MLVANDTVFITFWEGKEALETKDLHAAISREVPNSYPEQHEWNTHADKGNTLSRPFQFPKKFQRVTDGHGNIKRHLSEIDRDNNPRSQSHLKSRASIIPTRAARASYHVTLATNYDLQNSGELGSNRAQSKWS